MRIVFVAYRSTLQADALKLVAQKLQSSLPSWGELPEDGLAAYGDDGDDLTLALARKIVAGEEDAGSVESVFEQARQVAQVFRSGPQRRVSSRSSSRCVSRSNVHSLTVKTFQ